MKPIMLAFIIIESIAVLGWMCVLWLNKLKETPQKPVDDPAQLPLNFS